MTLCARKAGNHPPRTFLLLTTITLALLASSFHPALAGSDWRSVDIGSPTLAGSTTATASGFTIEASGTDVWGASDQFRFVYLAVSGDLDIRARVDSVTYADAWSKAGLMIRGGLSANAAHAYVLVSAGKGQAFQRRTKAGGLTTNTSGGSVTPPRWLRLVRQGSRVTAYSSGNGAVWTQMGSDTIALGQTAYVGVAVTSHTPADRTTAQVSNITMASLSLPAGQASADIGAVTVAGAAAYADGGYSIRGAGEDIWDSADQFHYLYQQMTGDGTVIAHVKSLQYANSWSKTGVMIRETLAADSPHALALVSAAKGYAFQRRVTRGAWTDHTAGGAGTAPGWVRLVRKGSAFTASRSADGVTWTTMGTATIVMGSEVYAGIAVTSHNPDLAVTAVVDKFTVTETAPVANKPPIVSLTSPASSSTYTEPADIALTATASDPEGDPLTVEFYSGSTLLARDTTAPYAFTWRSVPAGTYTLTAVAIDGAGSSTVSSAVSTTVNAAAPAPSDSKSSDSKTPPATPAPRYVEFTASANHATAVTSYLLEVFRSGADPTTATPVASSNLGKPTPGSGGVITVDRAAFFSALAPGNYVAAVSAVGEGGEAQGTPVSFSR